MASLPDDLRQLIEHDQQTARPLLQDLAARLPNSAEAQSLLAHSYLRSLEAGPALEHYRRAHQLEPQNLFYRQQMGLCAVAAGDYAAAYDFYAKAREIAPTEHSEAMAALMLHRLGRLQDAVQAYSALLGRLKRDHIESPHALRGMTMLLRDLGAPISADRYLHDFISVFRLDAPKVAAMVMERETSIDFHGWTRFAHKSELARSLGRRLRLGGQTPRFPETFALPEDREALLAHATENPGAIYIAKPERGTGGQGIKLTRNAWELADASGCVVQRYVERPYLVDGRKGHVRLYGLVTSLDPFRAYLYRDGVVRFAPEPYELSDAGLADPHRHITNTALHIGHPGLVVSEDAAQENVGAIWSLGAYLERLKADGVDIEALRAELRTLMVGFLQVVASEGVFAEQARAGPRRAFPAKLFGLDVLIDADSQPWLIEAQRKPALGGNALVRKINGRMFQTLFEMSCGYLIEDVMPAERIAELAKDRRAQLQREFEVEDAHRGQFERIA